MRVNIVIAICLAALAGCATQYQRHGFTGGFDETQLQPNVYRVTFKGNGYTSADRAADFALLRSAELTLENGYNYFAIVDAKDGTKYEGRTFLISKPSASTTILMLKGQGQFGMTYDAKFIIDSLGQKYEVKKMGPSGFAVGDGLRYESLPKGGMPCAIPICTGRFWGCRPLGRLRMGGYLAAA